MDDLARVESKLHSDNNIIKLLQKLTELHNCNPLWVKHEKLRKQTLTL